MSFDTTGLRFLVKPTGSGGLVDRATHRTTACTATYATQSGASIASGWSGFTNADTANIDFATGPWSLYADFYISGNPADYPSAMARNFHTDSTHNGGWAIGIRGSGDGSPGYTCYVFNNADNFLQPSSPVAPAAGFHQIVLTSDGTTLKMYLDGTQVNSTTSFPSPLTANSHAGADVLDPPGGSGGTMPVRNAAAFARTLSSAEVAALTSAPGAIATQLLTYAFTGPSTGTTGSASANFTVTMLSYTPCVVTPHDPSGGTFTPAALTFDGTSLAPQTFTLNRGTSATANVTVTNSADLADPAAVAYTTSSGSTPPTTLTITTPATIYQGVATTCNWALDHPAVASLTFTVAITGVSGSSSASPITIGVGQSSGTFPVTTTTTGSGTAGGTVS